MISIIRYCQGFARVWYTAKLEIQYSRNSGTLIHLRSRSWSGGNCIWIPRYRKYQLYKITPNYRVRHMQQSGGLRVTIIMQGYLIVPNWLSGRLPQNLHSLIFFAVNQAQYIKLKCFFKICFITHTHTHTHTHTQTNLTSGIIDVIPSFV